MVRIRYYVFKNKEDILEHLNYQTNNTIDYDFREYKYNRYIPTKNIQMYTKIQIQDMIKSYVLDLKSMSERDRANEITDAIALYCDMLLSTENDSNLVVMIVSK